MDWNFLNAIIVSIPGDDCSLSMSGIFSAKNYGKGQAPALSLLLDGQSFGKVWKKRRTYHKLPPLHILIKRGEIANVKITETEKVTV